MLALLDGDIIVYAAAAGAEERTDWEDGDEPSFSLNPQQAVGDALRVVREWTDAAGCDECVVAFSGKHNFRKTLLPSYKQGRRPKPELYWDTKAAVVEAFPTKEVDGLEADDVMGIMATGQFKGRSVIVTVDKDLRTVPGFHFNPDKDSFTRNVSEVEADWWWHFQTLTGDSTDGYSGIPGVGPRKAMHILGVVGTCPWLRVLLAYKNAGLTEQDALTMARMARILRREDYDKENKEIILWHPVKEKRPRLPLATMCAA